MGAKKKLKRRIAALEDRVAALEAEPAVPSHYWWQPATPPWPRTGTQTYDPCAGCGSVCGNSACPRGLKVTS